MLTQLIPSPNNKTPSIVFQSSPPPPPSSLSRSLSLIKSLSVRQKRKRIRCASEAVETQQVAAMSTAPEAVEEQQVALSATKGDTTTVKAEVNVKMSTNISLTRGLDDIGDLLGRSVLLELVSAELDQETGDEKEIIGAYAHKKKSQNKGEVKYEGEFSVPKDFGEIGAILVENAHHKEMYIKDIILMTGDETTALYFDCRSWVHSKFDNPEKRIFFTTKMYFPSETPSGLQKWRTKELETLRGDGTGERKCFERIYDYDTYNDLGDPNVEGRARPVIGGSQELPYPRRCRTGRPKTKKDPLSEERKSNVYVPRDEAFSEVKQKTFSAKTLRSAFHALVPSIRSSITDKNIGFSKFNAIDKLFMEGLPLATEEGVSDLFHAIMPRLVKTIAHGAEDVLRFETPAMIHRDKFSWFRDEEFARQTLAGLNPFSIQAVTELPFASKLDPEIYGPAESALTEQIIERQIKGEMTVKEALEQKKLFVVDYHDLLLPFVHKVRELEDTTLYGSRTLFFLTPEGTLRPIAIELTRPKSPTKPQWKRVFTHSWDATGTWLWRHAKAHVCAHDAGFHQLYSHWLRTHCSTEPYVIALNRQLSVMHPIYQLLHPHFRYTLEINALAREYLISHGGIIETSFSPGKYAMELCSVAYGKLWRFDMEGLPADLLRRGMAVEDPSAEHGLRLTIEDYPYANDGLLIWSSIKKWVSDYVTRFYPTEAQIQQDTELQQWWTEIRSLGHADKQHEPWWPTLNSHSSLIEALSTIIWVTSGHHAAANFGQYHFAGYFPNRPTITRLNMPVEDLQSEEYEKFLQKPEATLLRCFPSQVQATVVMSILDVLSNHSPDEEYLGETPEPAWARDEEINAAFERFHGRMKEIEGIIDGRNKDPELKNRCGAGICPYELLKPFSEPGVTGKGVPKSITI